MTSKGIFNCPCDLGPILGPIFNVKQLYIAYIAPKLVNGLKMASETASNGLQSSVTLFNGSMAIFYPDLM